jgi:hypothetical protein
VSIRRSITRTALQLRRLARTGAARADGALRRRRAPASPRVLFYAADELSDHYLRRVGTAVAQVPHEPWFATVGGAGPGAWDARPTSLRLAPYRAWDLVVVANHVPLVFPPGTPMLGVLHGIVRSRPVAQGSYWYAPAKMLDGQGDPVFTRLFDASELSRQEGERFVPELRGRIRVVGDLRADDVLVAAAASPPRQQVLVMSTWGPEALVPRHLAALAPALASAAAELGLEVVVTSHPNLWQPQPHRHQRDHSPDLLALRDLGFTVLEPDADWAPWLASSRLVLCDHTSLAANFALLDRPILPVEVSDQMIGSETFTECLYQHVVPWTSSQDLVERIRRALDEGLPPGGGAGHRTAEAFAELLDDLRAQPGS